MESLAKILPMFLILLVGTTQVTAGPAQCSTFCQLQKNINSLQAEVDKLKQSCCTQGRSTCFSIFYDLPIAWIKVCKYDGRLGRNFKCRMLPQHACTVTHIYLFSICSMTVYKSMFKMV